MRIFWISILLLTVGINNTVAQRFGEPLEGVNSFYAETKQVNQFFRRFNCDEAPDGERYYPGDKLYRDREQRLLYLPELFDKANPSISKEVKQDFIDDIVKGSKPIFLDFHGGKWFAEVNAAFTYNGKRTQAKLFMKLQEEKVGSKWVFEHVIFEPFVKNGIPKQPQSIPAVSPPQKFLHPMSHELDFMNLRKVFSRPEYLFHYLADEPVEGQASAFLYACQKGRIQFISVNEVKFHFMQIDNWYFELSEFNRPGTNRGWLISQLSQISESDKQLLKKYIFQLI